MTQVLLTEDREGNLDTQINKIRLIKELAFDTACSKDPIILQLAKSRDRKGVFFVLHHILQDLVDAYDTLLDAAGENKKAAGGVA